MSEAPTICVGYEYFIQNLEVLAEIVEFPATRRRGEQLPLFERSTYYPKHID